MGSMAIYFRYFNALTTSWVGSNLKAQDVVYSQAGARRIYPQAGHPCG